MCSIDVSTEDQAREGFSLPEQKERLEAYCKLNNFEIVDYYEDAGISAKKGNYRPEWERLKEDIKSKKINTMIALKQELNLCVIFLILNQLLLMVQFVELKKLILIILSQIK